MIYFINLKHYFNLGKSQVEGKFAIVGYVPYGKVNIYIYIFQKYSFFKWGKKHILLKYFCKISW